RDAGDVQRQQRDQHGDACEEHGTSGGAVGKGDRLGELVAFLQLASVPVDDEQGIVDATARPSMMPRIGVTEIMSTTLDSDRAPRAATATPNKAFRIGRPAATREPSMISSTIAATTTPTSSPAPAICGIPVAISVEKFTCRPSMGLSWNSSITASLVSCGTS